MDVFRGTDDFEVGLKCMFTNERTCGPISVPCFKNVPCIVIQLLTNVISSRVYIFECFKSSFRLRRWACIIARMDDIFNSMIYICF